MMLTKPNTSASKRVFLIQVVFIVGFLAIFALEQLFANLIEKLDQVSQNERSRLFIGEQMIRDIESIEMSVYRMAIATGNNSLQQFENAIQRDVSQLKHSLDVLKQGGSVSQVISLNIESNEQMVTTVNYQPSIASGTILEVIELEPLVNEITEKTPVFRQLIEAKETHRQAGNVQETADHEQQIRYYIKQIPAFFTRIKENANRLNFNSHQKLAELEQNIAAKKTYYQTTKFILIFLVVLSVMIIGIVFSRQINRINQQLTETYQAMLVAKEDADKASRAKSDFVSRMSHELRTPLNAILGFAQLLELDQLTAQQATQVGYINQAGKHLLELINQVLDIAKIEAGQLDIEQIQIKLVDLVSEIGDMQHERVAQKGLSLYLEVSEDLPEFVQGDPTRLKQVLINLIGNAVKFCETGSIRLKVFPLSETTIRFEIIDTGIGMDEPTQNKLFNPFIQADSSITRRYGGTGLGLTLCKEIVEAQQGKIGVVSELGKGSCFWFELPMPRIQAISAANQRDSTSSNQSISINHHTVSNRLKDTSVLLVEDNHINQMIAISFLKRLEIKPDIANNGQEALDMLHNQSYDLILLDLEMPIMDGYTAIQKIRENESSHPSQKRQIVIAMSANALSEDKQRAFDLGIDDYITKPVNLPLLKSTLEKWLTD